MRLASLTLLLALSGCDAGEPEPDGEITFLLNGQRWTNDRDARAVISQYGFVLSAEDWIEHRFPLNQSITFPLPKLTMGSHPVTRRVVGGEVYVSAIYESDGDAGVADYTAEAGRLVVESYDPTTGLVEGSFEGTYVVDPNDLGDPARLLPDTLRVTHGRFRATVEVRE